MEITKEKWFEVKYNTKLDRLVIRKQSLISKIFRKIKAHKLITTTLIAFIVFSILNIVMIYSFLEILQNI